MAPLGCDNGGGFAARWPMKSFWAEECWWGHLHLHSTTCNRQAPPTPASPAHVNHLTSPCCCGDDITSCHLKAVCSLAWRLALAELMGHVLHLLPLPRLPLLIDTLARTRRALFAVNGRGGATAGLRRSLNLLMCWCCRGDRDEKAQVLSRPVRSSLFPLR